jgi:hypothetical protein
MVDGKPRALPAPDNNYPSITQFEPGRTWAYLNTYREGNWIKVSLNDSSRGGLNRGGIGAVVKINGRHAKTVRSGSGSYQSNRFTDLVFGLGDETVQFVEVEWPDPERTKTRLDISGIKNVAIRIGREGLEIMPGKGASL